MNQKYHNVVVIHCKMNPFTSYFHPLEHTKNFLRNDQIILDFFGEKNILDSFPRLIPFFTKFYPFLPVFPGHTGKNTFWTSKTEPWFVYH